MSEIGKPESCDSYNGYEEGDELVSPINEEVIHLTLERLAELYARDKAAMKALRDQDAKKGKII